MATLYTTLDSATEIKELFKRYDRDNYPLPVYQAILDFYDASSEDDELIKLDVIAWCCDISETSIDEWNQYNDDKAETLEELSELLNEKTYVLCECEEENVVYHLAY